MKTKQVVEVYNTLNSAKLSKMDDKDKFLVIKAMRQLKPISISYEEDMKDAQEKLKDDNFEKMQNRAKEWEEKHGKQSLMQDLSAEDVKELNNINKYFEDYQSKVKGYFEEEGGKDNELTYEKLSEEAFGKLIASNDFDVKTIMNLQDALMKE